MQKTLTGTVKRVFSANHIQLQGKIGKSGLPLERDLYLIGISANNLSTFAEPIEEVYPAFESREFLRNLLIGNQVDFVIETTAAGRELASISINGQDVAILLLENGLAKINLKFEGQSITPKLLGDYQTAEEKAKSANKGVWGEGAKTARKLLKNVDLGKIFAKPTKVQGICEEYGNGSFIFYLPEHHTHVKLHLEAVNLPIINYKHQQELRIFVEERILQRNVSLKVNNYQTQANAIIGDIITEKVDIISDLVANGFAKLTNESVTELDINRYRALKELMDKARNENLRIWKDFKLTAKTTEKGGKTNEFTARVIEVHSGDSLTILNLSNNEYKRIFLSNIRAPILGNPRKGEFEKPGAFEAREFLRKLLVGKNVKVELEFLKNVGGKKNESGEMIEARSMECGSIFFGDKNVSETLLENGLVNVAMPRLDDEFTKYLKILKEAEEKARQAKHGLFSTQEKPVAKFIDLTQSKTNISKIKQFYSFNSSEKRIPGVVDLVLNGSRFKVRLVNQQTYIIFTLHGVRCLPNDSNVKTSAEISQKALLYSKENLLQRDVELEFDSVDTIGAICGTMTLNKKNYALNLIENGLAYVAKGGPKVTSKYTDIYEKAENEAKGKKLGMWAYGEGGIVAGGVTGWKELKESRVEVCSDISNHEVFYLQNSGHKDFTTIQKTLENFNEETEERLKPPIKLGTPCLALFLDDGSWYRAKIERSLGGDKFLVFYIDYGNYDEVVLDDMRKIPAKLSGIEPMSRACSLAYLKPITADSQFADEASEWLKSRIFNNKIEAKYCYQIKDKYYVVLQETGNKDPLKTINSEALCKGYAKLNADIPLPTDYHAWEEVQEKAAEKGEGLWGCAEENMDPVEDD